MTWSSVAVAVAGEVIEASWGNAVRDAGIAYTQWEVVNSAETLDEGDSVFADTSGGAFTITLPASPSTGHEVRIADATGDWASNNLTVDGNGNNINGSANYTADQDDTVLSFRYNGSEWRVFLYVIDGTGIYTFEKLLVSGGAMAAAETGIGQSAADGLELSGQGSTRDITLLNDAGSLVGGVPTGTQNWNFAGNLVVGDGTATGDGPLHINPGAAGSVTADASVDDLIVEGPAGTGISILGGAGANETQRVAFGNSNSNSESLITWNTSGPRLSFDTFKAGASIRFRSGNGGTALTLDSSQNANINSGALQMGGTKAISSSRQFFRSLTDSITAGSTQTQAGATALTTDINRVTTVGSGNDGVKLPTAESRLYIEIFNDGAKVLQVWPASGDDIEGNGADTVDPYIVPPGGYIAYFAVDSTNWHRVPPFVPQAEAEAGTETEPRQFSPKRIKQAIDAIGVSGLDLLATATASDDAAVEFTSNIDSTYDEYIIELLNVVPATNSTILRLKTSTDGGQNFDGSGSDYSADRVESGSSTSGASSVIGLITGVNSTASNGGASVTLRLIRPASASEDTYVTWFGGALSTAVHGIGRRQAAEDVDALQFFFSSGNIASGEFKLYGLKKST